MEVQIYTDGSCKGNPGKGGYGVVLMSGMHRKDLSQGYKLTTNNRMELMAVIAGLGALKKQDLDVTIYSDSEYVVNAVSKGWLDKWVAGGYKRRKNKDLWEAYRILARNQKVRFVWVKGHADNEYNNYCDVLANKAADGSDLIDDNGYTR